MVDTGISYGEGVYLLNYVVRVDKLEMADRNLKVSSPISGYIVIKNGAFYKISENFYAGFTIGFESDFMVIETYKDKILNYKVFIDRSLLASVRAYLNLSIIYSVF